MSPGIDFKINRPYIERLRRDPRTKALFDSFIYQAMVTVREQRGRPVDEHDADEFAHRIAERAVALAMAFVLDNDGEYHMVCEERDKLMERQIKGLQLTAFPTSFVQDPQA